MLPIISAVYASTPTGLIGVDNRMPWHSPEDLAFFKRLTLGHPVIMGRRTFESLGGKPLPGRLNLVLTRQHDWKAVGVMTVHSVGSAIHHAAEHVKNTDKREVFVIGGADVFAAFLPRIAHVYWTSIAQDEPDTAVGLTRLPPELPPLNLSRWRLEGKHRLSPTAEVSRFVRFLGDPDQPGLPIKEWTPPV